MDDQREGVEHVSPKARIQRELLRLESQKREIWILVAFTAAVLCLGVLSFLFPGSFWHSNTLNLSFSPQVLFLILVVTVIVTLIYIRQDLEIRGLRLANLRQILSSQEDRAASMIDSLTNVFARALLPDLLQGEISRAERTHRSLALMMCDINDFKQVNDRHGHLMGDYVLAQVAAILKSCVRGSDYVIRYGGDEFLILLPETDEKGSEIVRQRINEKVSDWDRHNRVGDSPISLSVGLYLHVSGQGAEKDMAEADLRMYAEKVANKRAAVMTDASSPPP
jgi:diguanylate cyclase (GGDEF)-like protein